MKFYIITFCLAALTGCMMIHQPCDEGNGWNMDIMGIVIMDACNAKQQEKEDGENKSTSESKHDSRESQAQENGDS